MQLVERKIEAVPDLDDSYAVTDVHINSVATVVPEYELKQEDVVRRASGIFGSRTALFSQLEPVFYNAEIDTRYTCLPPDWFEQNSDLSDKNDLFEKHALNLAEDVAINAVSDAGMDFGDIDAILFVSSTGIATPSIEARLMNRLAFRADTQRLPIFGLGCAGGVMGLSRAAQIVRSNPGMKALVIVLELCTLAYRYDQLSKSNLVATALFGDGAAAVVISSHVGCDYEGRSLGKLGEAGEHFWRDTLNIMGWRMDQLGFSVVFHRNIPNFVKDQYSKALQSFLQTNDLQMQDIDRPCCHPGGAKVISALEGVFHLGNQQLGAEREVLRQYGNMSSPTVLFVLRKLLDEGFTGKTLMSALGPGFTAAFQELTVS